MGTFQNLKGKHFGELTADTYLGGSKWLCKCSCGNTRIVLSSVLNAGKCVSCGCKNKNIIYHIDNTFFENMDTEFKAYTLGFIAADGSVSSKNNLIKIDQLTENEDILIKIKNAMNYDNSIKHYKSPSYYKTGDIKEMSRLNISNAKMVKDIKKYGIVDNKTITMNIDLELIPKDMIRHFYRGLFEGDGFYSIMHKLDRKTPLYGIGLTSSDIMIDKTIELLKTIFPDITIYKYYRKENKHSAELKICNKQYILEVLNWLYDNCNIYQNIKYNKMVELVQGIQNDSYLKEGDNND